MVNFLPLRLSVRERVSRMIVAGSPFRPRRGRGEGVSGKRPGKAVKGMIVRGMNSHSSDTDSPDFSVCRGFKCRAGVPPAPRVTRKPETIRGWAGGTPALLYGYKSPSTFKALHGGAFHFAFGIALLEVLALVVLHRRRRPCKCQSSLLTLFRERVGSHF